MELAKFIVAVLLSAAVVTAFLGAILGRLIHRNRRASAGQSGSHRVLDATVKRGRIADSYEEEVRKEPAAYSTI